MTKQKISCLTLGTQDRIILKTRFGLVVIDDNNNHIDITQASNKELADMLRNEIGDIGSTRLANITGGL